MRPSLFALPPHPRVLGVWLVGERGRQAGRLTPSASLVSPFQTVIIVNIFSCTVEAEM